MDFTSASIESLKQAINKIAQDNHAERIAIVHQWISQESTQRDTQLIAFSHQLISKEATALAEKTQKTDDYFKAWEASKTALSSSLISPTSQMAATLLERIGINACRLGELTRRLEYLKQGEVDFEKASEIFLGKDDSNSYLRVQLSLGTAKTRRGELSHDIKLLKRALSILDKVLKKYSKKNETGVQFLEDWANTMKTRAVALMRIGEYCGDSSFVSRSIKDLQNLVTVKGISKNLRTKVMVNTIAALSINANQMKSQRIYKETLDLIDKWTKNQSLNKDNCDLFYYKAHLLRRLSQLSNDHSQYAKAAEINRWLATWHESQGEEVAAARNWHACGAALQYFSKSSHDRSLYQQAIAAYEKASFFFSSNRNLQEWVRLEVDLGTLEEEMGKTFKDQEINSRGISRIQGAIQKVSAEIAPSFYSKISDILFRIYCGNQEWRKALQVFYRIEEARSYAYADPSLTAEVYHQVAREMLGSYALASWCQFQVGEIAQAIETVERGRARGLAVAMNLEAYKNEQLHEREVQALNIAQENVVFIQKKMHGLSWPVRPKDAQNENEDFQSLKENLDKAWKQYLSLRREFGLDLNIPSLSIKEILETVPDRGVLVIISISPLGSAAYVLPSGTKKVSKSHALELGGDTFGKISKILYSEDTDSEFVDWHKAYSKLLTTSANGMFQRDDLGENEVPKENENYKNWTNTINSVLEVLWQYLMRPVHERIQTLKLAKHAKVVFCLPGNIAALPVHAACLTNGPGLLDHWSVSVAPSVHSLKRCKERLEERSEDVPTLLVVSDPVDRDGFPTGLTFAENETKKLRADFKGLQEVHFQGRQATIENVLLWLPNARFFHSSCHGEYDWNEPSQSGLELAYEHRLSISMLLSAPEFLKSSRLIFLSACESGICGKNSVPDEFYGLPSGFLQAGGCGIVATLWPVFDDTAMFISRRFYKNYLNEKGQERSSPAEALREAVSWLKSVTVAELQQEYQVMNEEEAQILSDSSYNSDFELVSFETEDISNSKKSRGLVSKDQNTYKKNFPFHGSNSEPNFRPYSSPHEWAAFVLTGL